MQHDRRLERISQAMPNLVLDSVAVNTEGLVNDVVIVNDEVVFRFPKTDWGKEALAREVKLLGLVREHVAVTVPEPVLHGPDIASHRLVRGEPFTRDLLYRQSPERSRQALDDLGGFLRDLHAIPAERLCGMPASDAVRTRAGWLEMYSRVEEHLFPLLFRHQRQAVEDHFAPVVSGRLEMEVEPVLIHGDLAPYHILVHPDRPSLAGVIDFGTAGLGDPATDIATLLVHYGGRLVDALASRYPLDERTYERARFRAGCLELEWALIGIRNNDLSMLVAHIGGARDYPPMDAFEEAT